MSSKEFRVWLGLLLLAAIAEATLTAWFVTAAVR